MKLLTKAIEKELAKYPIDSQEGKGEDATVICKFFNPCGSQTWYVLEGDKYDKDYRLFVLYKVHNGQKYGYVMLNELQEIVLEPFALGIERDIYFSSCKVSELKD